MEQVLFRCIDSYDIKYAYNKDRGSLKKSIGRDNSDTAFDAAKSSKGRLGKTGVISKQVTSQPPSTF
jgi:hypothetical protein